MASTTTIARLCGLTPRQVFDVFRAIHRIVSRGECVKIRGFGRFDRKIHKGRTQMTPLVENGLVTYGDMKVMRFSQSPKSRMMMNRKKKRRVR